MTVFRVWRILASTRATDGRNRWSLRLPQWWSCPVVGSPYRCSYDLPVVPGSSKFIASCPSPETTDQLQGPSPATERHRESGRRHAAGCRLTLCSYHRISATNDSDTDKLAWCQPARPTWVSRVCRGQELPSGHSFSADIP